MPSKVKLLLVEDETQFSRMFRAIADTIEGVEVHHVTNRTAINGELRKCDVMFLDLILPDSSGLDTVARINRYSEHLPVVVCSSLDDDETVGSIGATEAVGYMSKADLTKKQLRQLIRFAASKGKDHAEQQAVEDRETNTLLSRLRGIGKRDDCPPLQPA